MQTLRRHPLAKAVAIFLLALSMFAAVILGITTVVFYSVGIYHTNDTIAQDALRSLQTTVLEIEARETGDQIMYQMDAFIQDPEITREDCETFAADTAVGTNLRWEMSVNQDGAKTAILGNMESCRRELGEDCAPYSAEYWFNYAPQNFDTDLENLLEFLKEMGFQGNPWNGDGFIVLTYTFYFVPALGENDIYAFTDALINTAFSARGLLPWLCVLFLALSAALLAFLIWAAGWRRGQETVVLNLLDRIPLDLFTAALAVPFVAGCVLTIDSVENIYWGGLIWLLAAAGGLLLVGVPCLALILSMSARLKVKEPRWWENTLVVRVFRFCIRKIRAFLRWGRETVAMVPGIWRYVLAITGLGLLELLLFFLPFLTGHYATLVLFPLANLFVLAAFIRIGWDLRLLLDAGRRLAEGELSHQLDTKKLRWLFREHGEHLNAIGQGMNRAVERELRAERMRTELITNVSHDIKTPLTSIVNYVDLLQKPHDADQEKEYLEVLSRQSGRLKRLTEDLVEASKASAGAMEVHLERRDLTELLRQALGEYAGRLAAAQVEPVLQLPAGPLWADVDGRLLWRAMDNLLSNAAKYALPGTRLYCQAEQESEEAVIRFKNVSREPLDVAPEELMERFVRGDASRSTEGSGLGLNIAQSLAKLQGGRLELHTDGDLFKAELRFPAKPCAWESAVVE